MIGLRHVIALMANAVLVGSFLTLMLAQGHYSAGPVIGAILLGCALTWPVACLVARWIKIEDPLWDAARDRPTAQALRLRTRDGQAVRLRW